MTQGRRPLASKRKGKSQLSLSIEAKLRAQLVDAATATGRRLSEEAADRLRLSFFIQRLVETGNASPAMNNLWKARR